MTEVLAYIGLGSNLNDPALQLRNAIAALAGLPQTRVLACSSLYRSAPMGPQDQPHYLNMVAELGTSLDPETLLDKLQDIERSQGRVRVRRWGPRTLDLDILLYGDDVLVTKRLIIPHPGIAERSFVLYPLAEICGQLEIPGLGAVQSLLEERSDTDLTRLPTSVQSAG